MSLSRRAGGLFTSVRRLAQTLRGCHAIEIDVLGVEDKDTLSDLPQWSPLVPKVCRPIGPRAFSYSPQMARELKQLRPDLAHTQGIWMARSLITLGWARRTGKPYLVTPRGMLDPWALKLSRWKKRFAERLFEKAHLHQAACIHALNEEERQSIRYYGLCNPVCIIPNGIDLPTDGVGYPPPWPDSVPNGANILLYIGRLHPKKGLFDLLSGWAAARAHAPVLCQPWYLCIAGWDQGNHSRQLHKMVAELKLGSSVKLIGPQFGDAKDAALRSASAFILPSHSEGLPMSVLEAWAYRLPVLMTKACNLPAGFSAGAALRIDPNPHAIMNGLMSVFEMAPGDARTIGMAGRLLVEERYCWEKISTQMHEVYEWILGGGSPPPSVELL
jgi:poly(glycerol-phosphate) alpha-glucosyltransferase